MVNAYRIDFDNPPTEHNCELITDEHTIVDNYVYFLDNYQQDVDQRIKEIFDEKNAEEIPEDWFIVRGPKPDKRNKKGSSSHHPQKFTVYSSEDSRNHCENFIKEF
uniref:Uncharacterized protein n=1 Tax=Meloidogyne enterolobii TaxID=390850 RepID=A0A6V7UW17_MELEN|nr:unnamed protein product [Meloidogyne enterolobii]